MNTMIAQQLNEVRTRIKDLEAIIETKQRQLAEARELEKLLASKEAKSAPVPEKAPEKAAPVAAPEKPAAPKKA